MCHPTKTLAGKWTQKYLQTGGQNHDYVHKGTRSAKHNGCVFRQLHWLPVKWRINYKISQLENCCRTLVVLVFRALHGLAPAYVSILNTTYEPHRALRSTGSECSVVPRHNLERYDRRSFSCAELVARRHALAYNL